MRETHKVDSDLRISVQTGDTLEGLSKRFIIPVMPPCFSAWQNTENTTWKHRGVQQGRWDGAGTTGDVPKREHLKPVVSPLRSVGGSWGPRFFMVDIMKYLVCHLPQPLWWSPSHTEWVLRPETPSPITTSSPCCEKQWERSITPSTAANSVEKRKICILYP